MTNPKLPQINPDMQRKIADFVSNLIERFTQHQPILTSLKKMGVKTKIEDVHGLGPCIIIPVNELMQKEYLHMSGVNIADLAVGGDE